jgi:hypothetical protein
MSKTGWLSPAWTRSTVSRSRSVPATVSAPMARALAAAQRLDGRDRKARSGGPKRPARPESGQLTGS